MNLILKHNDAVVKIHTDVNHSLTKEQINIMPSLARFLVLYHSSKKGGDVISMYAYLKYNGDNSKSFL